MTWTFDVLKSKSKSRNTPFDGYTFRGAPIATVVGGRIVHLHHAYARMIEPKESRALVT
jgi:dihydroorotase